MRARLPLPELAVLALAGALLSGCAGGDGLLPAGGVTAEAATGATAVGGATAAKKEAFNPFADATSAKPGAREVIASPTLAEVMQTGTLPEMAWGRADAPVTVIKYASLTCPYCRRFHLETFPHLKREYIDTGKVRFIIREFPIGHASGAATIALRCAAPDKYLDLYGRFLSQQASWVSQEVRLDAIYKVAAHSGLSRERFDACRQDKALISGLNWVKDRGRTLGVIGTPNFFVDNRRVKTIVGLKEMREMIDAALATKVAAKQ